MSTPGDCEKVVTLRQLNQDTAGVIQRVCESGESVMLTRMGIPRAIITPLPVGIESELVAKAIDDDPHLIGDDLNQKYLINRIRTAWRVWRKERKRHYPDEDGRYGISLGWQAYLRKPRTWEGMEMPVRLTSE